MAIDPLGILLLWLPFAANGTFVDPDASITQYEKGALLSSNAWPFIRPCITALFATISLGDIAHISLNIVDSNKEVLTLVVFSTNVRTGSILLKDSFYMPIMELQ